jgi:hypothetical protein
MQCFQNVLGGFLVSRPEDHSQISQKAHTQAWAALLGLRYERYCGPTRTLRPFSARNIGDRE